MHKGAKISLRDPEISIEEAKEMTEQVLDIIEAKAELLPLEKVTRINTRN